MTVHRMKLMPQPFEKIKSGIKTVEVRLNDEKRKKLVVGDEIVFDCGGESIKAKVIGLYAFDNFSDLFKSELFDKTGNAGYTAEQAADSMYAYYTREKEREYGALAIELELI